LSGAESITFHAGFYLSKDPAPVYLRIRDEPAELARYTATIEHPVDLSPELTGKATQFGSLEEILGLSSEIKSVRPCIDWSHHHARHGGQNNESAFQNVINRIRNTLGADALHTMHMHLSGIEFGQKGERKHLNLEESDMNWRGLIGVLKANDVRGILICESPSIEDDALLLKSYYDSL
jgi:deoxyribonuclease IV